MHFGNQKIRDQVFNLNKYPPIATPSKEASLQYVNASSQNPAQILSFLQCKYQHEVHGIHATSTEDYAPSMQVQH